VVRVQRNLHSPTLHCKVPRIVHPVPLPRRKVQPDQRCGPGGPTSAATPAVRGPHPEREPVRLGDLGSGTSATDRRLPVMGLRQLERLDQPALMSKCGSLTRSNRNARRFEDSGRVSRRGARLSVPRGVFNPSNGAVQEVRRLGLCRSSGLSSRTRTSTWRCESRNLVHPISSP